MTSTHSESCSSSCWWESRHSGLERADRKTCWCRSGNVRPRLPAVRLRFGMRVIQTCANCAGTWIIVLKALEEGSGTAVRVGGGIRGRRPEVS